MLLAFRPSPGRFPSYRSDRTKAHASNGDKLIGSSHFKPFVLVRLTMSKQRNAMENNVGKFKSAGGWNKFKRERPVKLPAPQFEVTGTHVVILVGVLFTLAWFAGLLPDP